MNLERGFRRIATLLSMVTLAAGLLFTTAVGAALVWSSQLDRQRRAALAAEGCPNEDELRPLAERMQVVGVTPLGERRWRVRVMDNAWLNSDLRPLFASGDFRAADREHRRVLLAAAHRDFSKMDSSEQDVILRQIAATVPEPLSEGGSFTAQLRPVASANSEMPIHTWRVVQRWGGRVLYVDSPYALSKEQLREPWLLRFPSVQVEILSRVVD